MQTIGLGQTDGHKYNSSEMTVYHFLLTKLGAVIALWICLRLPCCSLWFESQAHRLHLFHFCYICHCVEKRTKIKKRPGLTNYELVARE